MGRECYRASYPAQRGEEIVRFVASVQPPGEVSPIDAVWSHPGPISRDVQVHKCLTHAKMEVLDTFMLFSFLNDGAPQAKFVGKINYFHYASLWTMGRFIRKQIMFIKNKVLWFKK